MIELTRTHEIHAEWRVKILGVGSAGTHAVDRLTRDGLAGVEILATNTDARALSGAATSDRIVLGQRLTRGLGAGGDPELGSAAARETSALLIERVSGASLVVLLAGLGGGTGSGATPEIARIARSQGAHVAVFATLPFSFEGRRRREQALEALDALRANADLVICFENDRMPSVSDPSSGIEDAFEAVDSLLAQSVRALISMTRRRNVLHSGLDEIAATVAEPRSTALFGYGAADGEERARAAVAKAFSNPLLDSEGALQRVSRLWVYVAGGSDMRWSEVQALMQEVSERVSENVRLFFGAAVDPQMAGAISVTLLAGIPDSGTEPSYLVRKTGVESGAFVSTVPAPTPEHSAPAAAPWTPVQEVQTESFVQQVPGAWSEPNHSSYESHIAEDREFASRAEVVSETVVESHQWVEPPAPEASQSHSRAVATPPFELNKERRREIALQEPLPNIFSSQETRDALTEDHGSSVNGPSFAASQETDAALELPPLQYPGENVEHVDFEHAQATPDAVAPAVGMPHAVLESNPQANQARTPSSSGEGIQAAPQEPARKSKDGVQEQMRFDAPNRGGRFEKTDPTIVDGEDLDVPTFMRQKLHLD